MEGRDADGLVMHWIFSEMTPHSFRWRAEESVDDGKTWQYVEEMRIRKSQVL